MADIFPVHSVGIVTGRDEFAISTDRDEVEQRVRSLTDVSITNPQIKERYLRNTDSLDLSRIRKRLRESPGTAPVIPCLYRPFDRRWIIYADLLVERTRRDVMQHMNAGPNLALVSARTNKSSSPDHFFCSAVPTEAKCGESTTQSYLFPLFTYPSHQSIMSGLFDAEDRVANFSESFVSQLRASLGVSITDGNAAADTIGPIDVFNYIYAILHAPSYRARFAEFLKIEFPRVPITSDVSVFRELAKRGAELVGLHLMAGEHDIGSNVSFPRAGDNVVDPGHPRFVASGNSAGRVYISGSSSGTGQYFEGVSESVWEFTVGGYRVCEHWLRDRRGRALSYDDITYYQGIVGSVRRTIDLMSDIDATLGAWPLG
ncbi:MAG: hypothetical protein M3P30_14015 [Chloroflexota bacterium]|nr:hypothetical protein [Chloroflexota bacterium]